MVAIAFFMLENALHNHSEVIKDDIMVRSDRLFQTYYGKAIGAELIWKDDIK